MKESIRTGIPFMASGSDFYLAPAVSASTA
jgi:hypothetical protein